MSYDNDAVNEWRPNLQVASHEARRILRHRRLTRTIVVVISIIMFIINWQVTKTPFNGIWFLVSVVVYFTFLFSHNSIAEAKTLLRQARAEKTSYQTQK